MMNTNISNQTETFIYYFRQIHDWEVSVGSTEFWTKSIGSSRCEQPFISLHRLHHSSFLLLHSNHSSVFDLGTQVNLNFLRGEGGIYTHFNLSVIFWTHFSFQEITRKPKPLYITLNKVYSGENSQLNQRSL